jgi:hypothetical protein
VPPIPVLTVPPQQATTDKWKQVADETLMDAFKNPRRFTKDEYTAIFTEFHSRGLRKPLATWAIILLILFYPAGIAYLIYRGVQKAREKPDGGSSIGKTILIVLLSLAALGGIISLVVDDTSSGRSSASTSTSSTTSSSSSSASRRRQFVDDANSANSRDGIDARLSVSQGNDTTLQIHGTRSGEAALAIRGNSQLRSNLRGMGFTKILVVSPNGDLDSYNL